MAKKYKQALTNVIAVKAINTIIMYCAAHNCQNCILREDLKRNDYCLVSRLSSKKNFGFFTEDYSETHAHKSPKFDGNLQLSQDFKSYLTSVLDRALADEGIDSQDLVKHGELTVKIEANGLVKVGARRDGRVKILGKAKCHPDDAFNLETGVHLAVRRMVQGADTPFDPHAGCAYYFVDYDGSIKGKPWNDDVIDNCNRALDNCFNSTFAAWLHITSVKRGIRHLADALRLTPPEPGKVSDADE